MPKGKSLEYLFWFVGLTALSLALFLVVSRLLEPDLPGAAPAPFVLACSCCLLAVLLVLLNDVLVSSAGRLLLHIAAGVGVAAVFCMGLVSGHLQLAVLPFVALGVVALGLLYLMFLVTLTHRILLALTSSSITFCGIVLLPAVRFSQTAVALMAGGLVLLAFVCALALRPERQAAPLLLSRAESKSRVLIGGGNNNVLFGIGFMLGVSGLLLAHLQPEPEVFAIAVGASIAAPGFLSLFLRERFHSVFEELALRCMAAVTAFALLPFPFVPFTWQAVLVAVFTALAVTNLIIFVNAIAETARFNIVSPIWILGKEGLLCLLGLACAALLGWVCGSAMLQDYAIIIMSFATVAAVCLLQIPINRAHYPFFDEQETSRLPAPAGGAAIAERLESEEAADPQADHRKPFWRAKLDAIAAEYGLSPRQKEIMELLIKGRDSKYIMNSFNISRSTAKTHIYNLYRKMDIHSRQDLLDIVEQTHTPDDADELYGGEG